MENFEYIDSEFVENFIFREFSLGVRTMTCWSWSGAVSFSTPSFDFFAPVANNYLYVTHFCITCIVAFTLTPSLNLVFANGQGSGTIQTAQLGVSSAGQNTFLRDFFLTQFGWVTAGTAGKHFIAMSGFRIVAV